MKTTIHITLAIVFCWVVFSQSVFAEGAGIEWDILNDEAFKQYQEGNYSKAILIAKQALEIAVENVGPDHPDVANILENMADLYREMKRDEEALELENRAARIRAIER